MSFRMLTPGDSENAVSFLSDYANSSVYLLSQLLHDSHSGVTHQPVAGYFDNDELKGIATIDSNRFVITQCPGQSSSLTRYLMSEYQGAIAGILGPENQVDDIVGESMLDRSQIELRKPNTLYHIAIENLVLPARLTSGDLVARQMENADLQTYTDWLTEFNTSTRRRKKTDQLISSMKAEARNSLQKGLTWVLESNGVLLSACTISAIANNIMQVGVLWTPVNNRSREYGRSILAACLFNAWSSPVKHCVLYGPSDNIPLKKACESIGFSSVGNYSHIIFKEELPNLF